MITNVAVLLAIVLGIGSARMLACDLVCRDAGDVRRAPTCHDQRRASDDVPGAVAHHVCAHDSHVTPLVTLTTSSSLQTGSKPISVRPVPIRLFTPQLSASSILARPPGSQATRESSEPINLRI